MLPRMQSKGTLIHCCGEKCFIAIWKLMWQKERKRVDLGGRRGREQPVGVEGGEINPHILYEDKGSFSIKSNS